MICLIFYKKRTIMDVFIKKNLALSVKNANLFYTVLK